MKMITQKNEEKQKEKASFIKIEWLWKTKLSYDKVEILRNPFDNFELFYECFQVE